jgi:nucleoside-diphosphate-sugar epimerase
VSGGVSGGAVGTRILVTGISGAVGSELAEALASRRPDAELTGVFSCARSRDDFLLRASRHVAAAVRPVVCDLTDAAATAALPGQLGPTERMVVVHAAANVSWTASPEAAWRANVTATANVAAAARVLGGSRFLLVSSAYTAADGWEYRNVYEETKAAAERMLRADYPDLRPAVFSCSLVVGHSQAGTISRFHGIYPLLGLLERHQPPFLPGDRDRRIDIVPVDWVAAELSGMAGRMLGRDPVPDVVAAAGTGAPKLCELVVAVIGELNRNRRAQGRAELADIPLVPFRRWDFLRRSVDAWKITEIRMPNQQFLRRLVGVYRPYFENARVRPPEGVSEPPPPWEQYIGPVIDRWLAEHPGRPASAAS